MLNLVRYRFSYLLHRKLNSGYKEVFSLEDIAMIIWLFLFHKTPKLPLFSLAQSAFFLNKSDLSSTISASIFHLSLMIAGCEELNKQIGNREIFCMDLMICFNHRVSCFHPKKLIAKIT